MTRSIVIPFWILDTSHDGDATLRLISAHFGYAQCKPLNAIRIAKGEASPTAQVLDFGLENSCCIWSMLNSLSPSFFKLVSEAQLSRQSIDPTSSRFV
jgi:hypothetical protein